jgi:hypothetical protein
MWELLGSVLTGGATGLLGMVVTSGLSIWEAKEKRETLKVTQSHELVLLEKQAEIRGREIESEQAIAEMNAAAARLAASMEHDASYGKPSKAVGNVLRFFRPLLTLFLLGLVAAIYFTTRDLGTETEITNGVLYMATAAGLWWFGDRASEKRRA